MTNIFIAKEEKSIPGFNEQTLLSQTNTTLSLSQHSFLILKILEL